MYIIFLYFLAYMFFREVALVSVVNLFSSMYKYLDAGCSFIPKWFLLYVMFKSSISINVFTKSVYSRNLLAFMLQLKKRKREYTMIEIKTSKLSDGEFNRGVFATQNIKKGEMIHQAPVIAYPNEQHEHIEKTLLEDYAFEYGIHHSAILLGYGMLFNHSYTPNATYDINFDNHTFDFFAYTDITAGEEILINYNGEVDNEDPLWFNKED